jgi:hypothetical protein
MPAIYTEHGGSNESPKRHITSYKRVYNFAKCFTLISRLEQIKNPQPLVDEVSANFCG